MKNARLTSGLIILCCLQIHIEIVLLYIELSKRYIPRVESMEILVVMCLGNVFPKRKTRYTGLALRLIYLVTFVVVIAVPPSHAQDKQNRDEKGGPQSSELAKENFDRVAASETQIAAVLRTNPGLFVELKRWIAKDASDHGQLIQDEDLEDSAVLTRLTRDAKFRSVATRLLQQYGYLLPTVNPDSEVGQEQDALIKERARQRAAAEQAEIAKLSQPTDQKNQTPAKCDPADTDCQNPSKTTGKQKQPESNPFVQPEDRSTDQLPLNRANDLGAANSPQPRIDANPLTGRDTTNPGQQSATQGQFGALPTPAIRQPLTDISTDQMENEHSLAMQTENPEDRTRRKEPKERGSFEIESAEMPAPPSVQRPWSPYSDIPSVYDIFVHSVTPAGRVERFGEEIFQNVPKDSKAIPIDLPASSEYVVGPGDGLTINLWGSVSQRIDRTVDREGRIALPEIGPVYLNGQTLAAVQLSLQQQLRTQFRDVSVDVSLSRLRTVRIYVVGDVEHAGAYDISSLSTPLNALLASGGPTPEGSLRVIKQYRGDELVQQVDLYDLLLHGVRKDIKPLEPGDTLLVPPVGSQIRVDGMVRRPAIYELQRETTLAQALDLAGGILPTAALSHIEVQRLVAHEKRTMLSLDISDNTNPSDVEAKLLSFAIQDRDEIHIFPISGFNQDAIYLQGHVARAGRYAYRPGMKLTDVISSYGDLLPEPATYAEIIRLNPPDFHPSVENFDLAAVLSNPSTAPALKPLDTIRIFNRFELENPPTVSVSGAVRKPGTFQMPGKIRIVDAIELAGGVNQNASMDSAQIIRTMTNGSLKILSVWLKEALKGDPNNNVSLEPWDRILVQENLLHADPPSVVIGGEVVSPGRYLLTGNLRVSNLVQMAGGLNRSADTESADLTQFVPSNDGPLNAMHTQVNLASALGGDTNQDTPLHDGDVLTIRQVPGWADLRALIHVEGEVQHPGTYGIRPGERLSSVLERAGGIGPDGYAFGAILERATVRELEVKEQDAMVLRVKRAQDSLELAPDTDPKQKLARQMAIQQWQSRIDDLTANPPVGRVSIRISSDINRWKDTSADIEIRAGDTLIIPKKPGYVMISGQAFNPTAVNYRPGRSAEWYLSQAGGPTPLADKKAIFVIRADGSVIGHRSSLWLGDSLGVALQPGDIVVVPEKALSGNIQFQNVLLAAQVAASIASAVFIAVHP
jgi:polysaccharide export outer membrane protein